MKKTCFVLFLMWSLLASASALSDDPFRKLIHRVWDSNSGLPQNSIYAITQDSSGFMWFGTAEGLVRFDG
ncbi:MAG TPA: two-component regulator propeller domain-containing protein, partial [bacterium]|nr:two-component regulator propeller domain-containing protein [bacterium]